MGLRINQNIAAMNAYRNLSVTDGQMAKSLEKLSSGFRINRAADDAAGLKVAVRNAQDGISVVQNAEGAMNEVHSILGRMRDLAVQASSSGSKDTNARTAAQTELTQLNAELDRVGSTTKFGSVNLLSSAVVGNAGTFAISNTATVGIEDGTSSAQANTLSQTFQIGANNGETLAVSFSGISSSILGTASLDLVNSASSAITALDTAIGTVSTNRANLGAVQNRLERTISNLSVATENLSASESRIRDTDMAQEMASVERALSRLIQS